MRVTFASYSDIGGRTINEDSAGVFEKETGEILAVVADGLGGHGGGDIASGIVLSELKRIFESDEDFNLENSIKLCNNEIINRQLESGIKMHTTATAVLINKNKAIIANVGDSRIYVFRAEDILFQTVDHSVAQMSVIVGDIKKTEIRNCKERNILTKALGANEDIKIDFTEISVESGDTILLCSDGFWQCVWEEDMISTLKTSETPENWIEKMRLIHSRDENADNDNNSAIALFIRGKR